MFYLPQIFLYKRSGYAFSLFHATYTGHPIVLDMIILITFGDEETLRNLILKLPIVRHCYMKQKKIIRKRGICRIEEVKITCPKQLDARTRLDKIPI
jgi:hypothetical protein